jgi:hypothetical protein
VRHDGTHDSPWTLQDGKKRHWLRAPVLEQLLKQRPPADQAHVALLAQLDCVSRSSQLVKHVSHAHEHDGFSRQLAGLYA